MLFELRDVGLRPRRPRRPRLGQRRDPGGRDGDRRPLGRRQVDAAAAAEPARRPRPRRDRLPRPPAARLRAAGAAARGLAGPAAAGAAGGDGRVEPALRGRASPASELDVERDCCALAGLDPAFAERDVAKLSVGEQQRAMLARALAQRPARPAARRADLGPRPRRPRRDRGDAGASCAASSDISLVLVSHDPEQARRLGDWVCGSRPAGWSARSARGGAGVTHLDPRRALAGRRLAGPGRARGGDLLLAAGRPRARHRRRHRPLVRPADPGRLRDQADLRGRHDLAGASRCWR